MTVNVTYTDSSLDTGLPRLTGLKIPLFDQVRDTVNVSVYYEKHALRLRASVHQRSTTLRAMEALGGGPMKNAPAEGNGLDSPDRKSVV